VTIRQRTRRLGNANQDGVPTRGWLIGHFVDDPIRRTEQVEVKWAHDPAGDARSDWVRGEQRTTFCMLISGRFRLHLAQGGREASAILARQGDYALWGPGVDHRWAAEEDSVVLTVRWPSRPDGTGA
jgi:hypothetical protein